MKKRASGPTGLCLAVALWTGACAGPSSPAGESGPEARAAVEATLDAWHAAASVADGAGYFGRMEPSAVFLGTDATERWSREELRSYAEPHFSAGNGWTYRPLERHVYFGARGELAWFDERLWNDKYGECRGSGVLRHADGAWRIVHYNLSFPVPNELTGELVRLVRERAGG